MDDFYYDSEIEHITEIIKNRLFFAVMYDDLKKTLKNTNNTFYFCTDDELIYMSYYYDFGPLNISCLYKFCCKLNSLLQCSVSSKKIVYYTRNNESTRVNSAYLIGSFAVIYLNMDPRQVYRMLLNAGGPYRTFVDASQGSSQYTIRLLDCLLAVEKALNFNFFDFNDFNVIEYDTHEKLQNGDMNWLLPRKYLAFIGPTENELMSSHPPEFYIKYFLKNDIKTVIRLNNKVYDASVFGAAGIDHYDLIFPDGTTPPKSILLRFLDISERTPHAVGVHCKAGLGRTGSLIGAYIIKHFRMTAKEAIAWMRICRPGSVIGQQQGWLERIEGWLWRQGSHYRAQHYGDGDKIPMNKYGIYSKTWAIERKKLQIIKKKEEERRNMSNNNVRHIVQPTMKMHISSADSNTRRYGYDGRPTSDKQEFNAIKKILSKVQDSLADTEAKHEKKVALMNSYYQNSGRHQNASISLLGTAYQRGHEPIPTKKMMETNNEMYKRNQQQMQQYNVDVNKRPSSQRNPYETTQGDKLNEIKMRKHITLTNDSCRKKQRKEGVSDSKLEQEEYSFEEMLRKRINHYTTNQGETYAKIRAKHSNISKECSAAQDARKRVLEILSPLKASNVEHMYRRN